MRPSLGRPRHAGRAPFEEAWFIEGSLDPDRAFWIRYTLSHDEQGPHGAVWAAFVCEDQVCATRMAGPLEAHADAWMATADGQIGPSRATGQVGALRWDLGLQGTESHDHLPRWLAALGLSGRHYASPALDLRVRGAFHVGERAFVLDDCPAVLGHIWGARANTRAWAWAHCTTFDTRPDLTFEALSARLTVGGVALPWATSAIVCIGGRRLAFTRTRTLFQARSVVGTDHWDLQVGRGDTLVHAQMHMPDPRRRVRAQVHHARTRVLNSPLASLRLSLTAPGLGRIEDRSRRCSLELAHEGIAEAPHFQG